MQVLYDESLEEPPPADRLRAMINILASGAELDAAMRKELIDALKRHEVRRENDRLRSMPGAGIAHSTWTAATIAKKLVNHHGANVKAGCWAAAESIKWLDGLDPKSVTENEYKKIRRAYDKLNASVDGFIETKEGKFKNVLISDALINYAATRLPRTKKKGD